MKLELSPLLEGGRIGPTSQAPPSLALITTTLLFDLQCKYNFIICCLCVLFTPTKTHGSAPRYSPAIAAPPLFPGSPSPRIIRYTPLGQPLYTARDARPILRLLIILSCALCWLVMTDGHVPLLSSSFLYLSCLSTLPPYTIFSVA